MTALLVVSLAVALLAAWGTALGFGLLGRVASLHSRAGSPVLRAAAALGPIAIAASVLVVTLVPSPLGACHCLEHGGGHPHLCFRHPWLAMPLIGWLAPVLVVWGVVSVIRVRPILGRLVQSERLARQLRRVPEQRLEGITFRLIDDGSLAAFTAGLFRPIIIVDRLLWQQLSEPERMAVIHHEHAHQQRRDVLTQACLQMAAALLPWPGQANWLQAWRASVERLCDRHAAVKRGDVVDVASALVTVERLRLHLQLKVPAEAACGIAAGSQLEERVHALLGHREMRAASLQNDLARVVVTLIATGILLLLWPGGFVHHAAESVLGILTH